MASYARKLKDRSGNYILPATRSTSVFMNNNQNLEEYLSSMKSSLQSSINGKASKLDVYPVGTYYYSSSSTSPASLFGGSWTAIVDAFIFGSGKNYKAGDMGGELVHTLSLSEIPSHQHLMSNSGVQVLAIGGSTGETTDGFVAGGSNSLWAGMQKGRIQATAKNGGGNAHNNMPPFITANIWRRTA